MFQIEHTRRLSIKAYHPKLIFTYIKKNNELLVVSKKNCYNLGTKVFGEIMINFIKYIYGL